ncbi:hypothetical protein [Methylobacter sp.]|uniref:hypothetical protein n=1 Tax=Methylobacter sp. TaxID=2051955 RepID=UPI001223A6D5|nr:hypothetical protein [Methylobacter sp.]TAK64167.1 MAG: hypothetical protein EPO18_04375 [Methylobacter sp.]
MAEDRNLYLTNPWITSLFIYYFFVLLVGFSMSILALQPDFIDIKTYNILTLSIIGSIGMALNGAAIFYIRKLYKLCFDDRLKIDDSNNIYVRRLGTVIYFFARPLFSIGFAILFIIGLQSGFMLTSNKPIELNSGFIYLTMFLSFFGGFLSGKVIKKLEVSGEKVISKVTR